jgi:hypothetical protein
LAVAPEDINSKNNKNTDNVQTRASFKEKIAQKRQQEQKSPKRTKNPYFVKTCKFMIYLISLISVYIVVKKLLEKFGFLETSVDNTKNKSTNNSGKEHVPLKQVELTEIKQQTDKTK